MVTTIVGERREPGTALMMLFLMAVLLAAGASWAKTGPSGDFDCEISLRDTTVLLLSFILIVLLKPQSHSIKSGMLRLLALCSTMVMPTSSQAQFNFTTNNDSITITRYTGTNKTVEIPSTINGWPVTSIGNAAFVMTWVKNVTIPNSVTNIGYQAFANHAFLTNIVFHSDEITIGASAFENCQSLSYCQLPDTVKSIGKNAFSWCISLTNINLPEGLSNIEYQSFGYCKILPFVIIPNSVTNIESSAFTHCGGLTNIILGTNLKQIGYGAFANCTNLASFDATPDNATFASFEGVLFNKNSTTLVAYPGGKRTPYQIPASVTRIRASAFTGSLIDEIAIPDTVSNIEDGAFSDCKNLHTVSIGSSVANAIYYQFEYCDNLTNIIVHPSNQVYSSIGGVLYNKTGSELVVYPNGLTGEFVVPAQVQSFGAGAFIGCRQLKSVILPDELKTIDCGLFGDCLSLTNVTLPKSIANIGFRSFKFCSQLTSITIPANVTNIESYAFGYCDSLSAIYFEGNAPVIASDVFEGSNPTIYYKAGTTGWGSTFGGCKTQLIETGTPYAYNPLDDSHIEITAYHGSDSQVTVPESIDGFTVSRIGRWAFYNNQTLTNLTLPNSLEMIDDLAFTACSNLTAVSFGTNLSNVGALAFCGCERLGSIVLPDQISYIGTNAFGDCGQLTNVVFPTGLTNLAPSAFHDCASLRGVALPESCLYVGDSAFAGCTNLTSASLPTHLLTLGKSAFEGCSRLGDIALPDSLTTLEVGVFAGCAGLTNATLGLGLRELGASAFSGTGLRSVAIGNAIGTVGADCYAGCANLTSVNLDASITNVGNEAFAGCYRLQFIKLSPQLAQLGWYAFRGCQALTAIELPDTLGVLSVGSLSDCTSLSSVRLPPGLTSIETSSFGNCASLTRLVIPNGLTDLGPDPFKQCANLTNLTFEGNAPSWIPGTNLPLSIIVYYYDDTTGWGDTFAGRPTVKLHRLSAYEQWSATNNLAAQFPNACGEQDDPDHDGLSNLQEMAAGTDPGSAKSALAFDSAPRQEALSAEDQSPLDAGQFALYFQTVPGKTYIVESCPGLAGDWSAAAMVTAGTAQKRVALPRPAGSAFYRVRLQP